jgi:hypothetical protein
MKSFGILRTNVGLTTNIKIMVESNYRLSLESIESNQNLSTDRFKKMSFNKTNFYDELVAYFFKDIPADLAFSIKYDDDVDTMSNQFNFQYDEIYQYGARNISSNKNYLEEYEYFAPLYIKKNNFPKKFIIFRVDGPGISAIDKENFKFNIVKNFKTVKLFDLTPESDLGQWIERNYTNNQYFPEAPLEIDFRNLEFCRWNGMDYITGGYVSRSLFIDDYLDEEKEIFELEKFVFDNYRKQKVVFPNILNFSFLFDDKPSTPDAYRKWSINRYFGFYLENMEKVSSISPYNPPKLKSNVIITAGNFLTTTDNSDPFVNGYGFSTPFYVEYLGEYYNVEIIKQSAGISLQQVNNNGFISEEYIEVFTNQYKIITDLDLIGKENFLNKNVGLIDEQNRLKTYEGDFIQIENFQDADVWIIEIDGIYHNIIEERGRLKLNTDYSFQFFQNNYTYKRAGETTTVDFIIDFFNMPKKFPIYKLKFSDVKDFDDRVVDTEFSKYEYEKQEDLTLTDETKMYFKNIESTSNPKDIDDFSYKNQVVNIPVSSEYTANFETFKIENETLTELWRKNAVHTRWSFQNSLSANDYPYLLNNSQIFEDFNRTVNPFDPEPKRIERNLDYFYTINSSTSSYIHHTLHVENIKNGIIDKDYGFDVKKYLNQATYSLGTQSLNYNFDYFTSFFERKAFFGNSRISKNVKKYSEFNIGDSSIPNSTVFRGIEFRIYDVDSISMDINFPTEIDTINFKTSNKFEDYKFSVLLSDNKVPFYEKSCFDIIISKEIVESQTYDLESFSGQELVATGLSWSTSSLEIFNYLGWYLEFLDVNQQNYLPSNYYISEVKIITPGLIPISYLELSIINDGEPYYPDTLIPNPYTLGTDIYNSPNYFINSPFDPGISTSDLTSSPNFPTTQKFRLVKYENRIRVTTGYLDRLKPGDKIYLESTCHTGTFSIYEDSNLGWNFNETISLIGDETNSPKVFYFIYTSNLQTELFPFESQYPFNGKKYYILKDEDGYTRAFCIWQESYQRWEIVESFDGVNSTTIYAYSNFNLSYPLDLNWTIVTNNFIWDGQPYSIVEIVSKIKTLEFTNNCLGQWCHEWSSLDNEMDWTIIEEWQMDQDYKKDTVVIFDDILYVANTDIDVEVAQIPVQLINFKPIKSSPYNNPEWDYYNPINNIFWNPNLANSYQVGEFIYRGDDYYFCATSSGDDFWNPEIAKTPAGYNLGDTVFYKDRYYISQTSSNNFAPDYKGFWFDLQNTPKRKNFWVATQSTNPKWIPIDIWNPSIIYMFETEILIVHNDIVWASTPGYTSIDAGLEPGISRFWERRYSIVPDTNFIYNNNNNPIIRMNNKYYLINSNTTDSTLENGIIIYINKKYKNIFINIAVNDNTIPNIKNVDRDLIYDDLYRKFTAYNFIQAINDLSNKYEFSDFVKYVVIDENGNINTYSKDNNFDNLPYMIKCEEPESFTVKVNSLEFKKINTPSELKPTRRLINGKIRTIDQLNWFNNVPYAYNIIENKFMPKVFENLHRFKFNLRDQLWRFSGFYMPLFYEIDLFEKDFEFKPTGNYKFDTSLTFFGIMKERKFRKINRKGSILKLKDSTDSISIYPMLDEFGYSIEDFFIFRSTWDLQYHTETVANRRELVIDLSNFQLDITEEDSNLIGIPFTTNQNFTI